MHGPHVFLHGSIIEPCFMHMDKQEFDEDKSTTMAHRDGAMLWIGVSRAALSF